MRYLVQAMYKGVGPILLLSVLGIFVAPGPVYSQYSDSLWVVAGQGSPGDSISVEVWLQYEGGGVTDSMTEFDIILIWDATVCSVESYALGQEFVDAFWADYSRIDNHGTMGPPAVPKIDLTAIITMPAFILIPRGTHLAATVNFRILDTATPGDSTYIDTLMEAFSPPIYLGYVDKGGITTYEPNYAGDWIVIPAVPGDFAPTSIISPPSAVFVDSTYTPSAVIRNFGSDSLGPIPVVCTINSWADTVEIAGIRGLDSTIVNFTGWTVPEPGAYTVTVITQYTGDTDPTNDTLSMAVQGYLFGDVGPDSITNPPDTVYVGNAYPPSAIIRNFGADSAGPIPVICNINSWTDTVEIPLISGSDSAIVNFTDWIVPDTGTFSIIIFTQYFADTNAVNDTILKSVQAYMAPGDVGADSIISPPDTVYSGYPYTPSARIVNFGVDAVGPIPVICLIDGYSDTVEILSIIGLDSTIINFTDWTVPDTGTFSVTIFTNYPADTNPSNDTILKTVYATYPPSIYTDSLWVLGGEGNAGDLLPVEVWLQYNGGGTPQDSMSEYDITLAWNTDVCTVEAIHIGDEFTGWMDLSRIDNQGVDGPPAGISKIGIFAMTFGPPVGDSFVERGTHLAATVDFRILSSIAVDCSTFVDTLYQAWDPPIWLGFVDKRGIYTYEPTYMGGWIIGHPTFCDVGPVSILSPPDTVDSGATYTPSAIIKNFGTDSAGPIPVIFTIDSWTDTTEILTIAGLDSVAVSAADWTVPGAGPYSVTVFTQASCDTNPTNDTLSKPVYVGVEEAFAEPRIPSVFGLSQSYPNPMSKSMNISYQIAKRCPVSLKIFDNAGRLVKVLVETELEPGYYTAKWIGKDGFGQSLSNGIYFYRLKAGDYMQTRKFIKLR